jgi:hypothetical protein
MDKFFYYVGIAACYLALTIALGHGLSYVLDKIRNNRPVGYYLAPSPFDRFCAMHPFWGWLFNKVLIQLAALVIWLFSVSLIPTWIVCNRLSRQRVISVDSCYSKNLKILKTDRDEFIHECNCPYAKDPSSVKTKSDCERVCKRFEEVREKLPRYDY